MPLLACSSCNDSGNEATSQVTAEEKDPSTHRLKKTTADIYYSTHQSLPLPSVMHATLPVNANADGNGRILVIGDIHGCWEELQHLVDSAVTEHNDGHDFDCIVLVGDLCNKGPQSPEVIRWARTTPNCYSVRGNHDDGALGAAIGDQRRRKKSKYKWVLEGESPSHHSNDSKIVLSDDDVTWLAELPYTLTIPGAYLGKEEDTLIVHAGLLPNLPLEDQSIDTMVTIREVLPICQEDNKERLKSSPGKLQFEFYNANKFKPTPAPNPVSLGSSTCVPIPVPWASVWTGPQRVIFGHDARRGLQRYPFAIGLDTGACYGKKLTGIILPTHTIVSVSAKKAYKPLDRPDSEDHLEVG